MTQEEEITRNLTLLEYYKEQLSQLDLQSQYMQAAIADYHKARFTVEQMKTAKKDTEVLIPIGGGTYLNGTLTDNSKILVDIGANFVSEKSIDGALKKLDERIKSLQENQQKIIEMAQKLQQEATELSEKTQQMSQQK